MVMDTNMSTQTKIGQSWKCSGIIPRLIKTDIPTAITLSQVVNRCLNGIRNNIYTIPQYLLPGCNYCSRSFFYFANCGRSPLLKRSLLLLHVAGYHKHKNCHGKKNCVNNRVVFCLAIMLITYVYADLLESPTYMKISSKSPRYLRIYLLLCII